MPYSIGFLKPASIQVQLISYQSQHGHTLSYQCQNRHKLLINQCQTNGHDLSLYVSTRTSYQCQQGHKLLIDQCQTNGHELSLFVSTRNSYQCQHGPRSMEQKGDQINAAALPYDYTFFADGTPFKYSEQVIVYAVIVHQTNISYINGVPSAKNV